MNEFQNLVDNLTKSLPKNISTEDKEEIEENINFIKGEIQNEKPRKSLLKNTFEALKKIGESTGVLANITQIADYVQRFIP
jgi:molecular chaperone DnaK (HSP70)